MTITLPPDIESRLKDEAGRRGLDAAEYARQLIETALPKPPVPDQATIDLLNQWEAEDATDDPEEIARRQQEGGAFMRNLTRNRIEMEGPEARKLWP